MKLIIYYLIFQTVYVILNTVKSILTIKSTKLVASIASAITYAVYVFVLIYTVADFSIYVKAGLTAVTNFVGTFISMAILERIRKDRIWKVEATIRDLPSANKVIGELTAAHIGFNYIITFGDNRDYIFNIYSKDRKESAKIRDILNGVNAKFTLYENNLKL